METEPNEEQIIIQMVQAKINAYAKKAGSRALYDWATELDQRIQKEYPDQAERNKYKLYHELWGSSGYEDTTPNLDFSGDLSIQAAVEKLEV